LSELSSTARSAPSPTRTKRHKPRGQVAGWAHQQTTSGPKGAGVALYSAFVVGPTLGIMAASGTTSSWGWPDMEVSRRCKPTGSDSKSEGERGVATAISVDDEAKIEA
jgi:hypothetical protein